MPVELDRSPTQRSDGDEGGRDIGLLIWNDLSNVSGYLIWNDLSNVSGYLRVTSDSGHGMTVTTERLLRRLITLIYAGRDRMVVIRRELPRTKRAGPACRPAA